MVISTHLLIFFGGFAFRTLVVITVISLFSHYRKCDVDMDWEPATSAPVSKWPHGVEQQDSSSGEELPFPQNSRRPRGTGQGRGKGRGVEQQDSQVRSLIFQLPRTAGDKEVEDEEKGEAAVKPDQPAHLKRGGMMLTFQTSHHHSPPSDPEMSQDPSSYVLLRTQPSSCFNYFLPTLF